jgi:hypothetical protein
MSKPLEKALLILNPIVDRNMNLRYSEVHEAVGYDESKKIPEVRRLLQTLGTEVGRNLMGEDVWLNKVIEDTMLHWPKQNVVVTGVRYPNELQGFKNSAARHSLESVWIERPGVKAINAHSSDNTLSRSDFDMYCINSGTLEDLRHWTVSVFK